MKKIIEKIILFLDKCVYSKTKLNLNKIIETSKTNEYEVRTDKGWSKFNEIHTTKYYEIYHIELENGLNIDCADEHIFPTINYELKHAKNLKLTDYLLVKDAGYIKIKSITQLNQWNRMFDLSLIDNRHLYYTNNILSHNTTTTSIFLLHRFIFNSDMNILIAANKKDKAEENLNMIKDLYRELPYFLKPGVISFNQKSFILETGSKITTQATTPNTGVGSSYQIVYIDEFSVIEPNELKNKIHARLLPTLSSFNNSLLIYSTTPRGKDVFYELYTHANEHYGLPIIENTGNNGFFAYTSFWHQIPGRNDVIVRYDNKLIKNGQINLKTVIDYFIENNYIITKIKFSNNQYWDIQLLFKPEKTTMDLVKRIKFDNGQSIIQHASITNWIELQRDQIPDKDFFEQEFNLAFDVDDRGLFDGDYISYFNSKVSKFSHYKIKLFEKLLGIDFDYSQLQWIDNPDIFKIDLGNHEYGLEDNTKFEIEKDGYYVISVDISDGLGQDYSVINIFKLIPFDKDRINNMLYHDSKLEFHEFIGLHQVGIYRDNKTSVENLAKILYHITYDILNTDNVKIVIEANKGCGDLISNLKLLYPGKSKFDYYNIIKTFHSEARKTPSPGVLVAAYNRSYMIADFKKLMVSERISVYNKQSINEISHFTKRTKRDGSFRYEAEKGHNDDVVMSIVIMSVLFSNKEFKLFLMDFMDSLPSDLVNIIEQKINDYEENIPDDNDDNYINLNQKNLYGQNSYNNIQTNANDIRKLLGY